MPVLPLRLSIDYGEDVIFRMLYQKKMQATMSAPQETQPKTMNSIIEAVMEPKISTYQITKGNKTEKRYKVALVMKDTEIPAFLTLAPLLTKFTEFSENGDAEKFGKNLEDGKMSVSLVSGVPRVVARQMPNVVSDQVTTVAKLKEYHNELVLHAFHNLPKKGAGSCSFATRARAKAKKEGVDDVEARAAEIYLENAHCGGTVEKEFEDGIEELVTIKRKVTSYENGVKGRYPPVFHKIDFSGKYHEVEVGDYLQRGTLVQCRARPQFFTAPSMYGTTLALDKDIIIVWRPKSTKRSYASAVIPAFVDGDDEEEEPDTKRARTE